MKQNPDTGRIFSQPPLISFKRDKNIGNFLARSAFQASEQPGTFKCVRARCKTCPFICNVEKLSGPKRSIKITYHFTCTSANVIYCMHLTGEINATDMITWIEKYLLFNTSLFVLYLSRCEDFFQLLVRPGLNVAFYLGRIEMPS